MKRAFQRRPSRRVASIWLISVVACLHAERSAALEAEDAAPVVDDVTRAAVRKLGDAGVAAYRAGNYEESSDKLEKAFALMPVPSLALWSARVLVARGAWTRAAERYLSARHLALGPGNPRIQLEAQRLAAEERAALLPRIPSLRVRVTGALASEVKISIDGAPLPALLVGEDWPVDPGEHVVTAMRGDDRVEATSSVREGEHAEVTLRFAERPVEVPAVTLADEPESAPPEARTGTSIAADSSAALAPVDGDFPWQTVGYVTLGVGGAVLITSGVLGLLALDEKGKLEDSTDCVGGDCLPALRDEVQSYNRLVDLSTAGWIGGVALIGAGTVLVLALPGADDASVAVSPNGVSVTAQF